jgi:hypothetical protein
MDVKKVRLHQVLFDDMHIHIYHIPLLASFLVAILY